MVHLVQDMESIKDLFLGWDETLIWSCLDGCMGQAYTDDCVKPESVQIIVADFCFFAGVPKEELVRNRPDSWKGGFLILVPQTVLWEQMIEAVCPEERRKKRQRFATKKEMEIFDRGKLQEFVDMISSPYRLEMLGEEHYRKVLSQKWSADLCSQFQDFEDYRKRGIGVVAVENGEIVSGASSYTVYGKGIEIEVDTREDRRRRGLARACCARLILECLDRDLYPSWDAHNKGSLALAEGLGYHFDGAYVVYEVTD